MNDIFRILEQIDLEKQEKFALATIIRIDGSSYRRAGAKMLLWEDGRKFGTISGGCLEDDLSIHSLEVIKTGYGKKVTYDLKDEDGLTWGIGCNGRIEVFIEPILNYQILTQMKSYLFSGKKIISVKSIKSGSHPLTFLFTHDGNLLENDMAFEYNKELFPSVLQFIKSSNKVNMVTIKGNEFLFEMNDPKSHLYIFGAGMDAEPLAKLASSLDFSVTVIDPRESRCCRDFFPTANSLVIEHPHSFFKHNKLKDFCFVVIMNHHFDRDRQILEHLIMQPIAYIGILGSRKRTERLLSLIKNQMPDKVHYPIGLNIKAEGPDEISVSIMAEMIHIRHQLLS